MNSFKVSGTKVIFSLLIGLSCCFSLPLKAQNLNTADSLAFVARCKYVLNCFDISKVNTTSYDVRQAGYVIGAMVQKGASLTDINSFAMKLSRTMTGQGFTFLPLIYVYIKYNSYFADSTKLAFKNALTIQNYNNTGSYNQQITLATARYLIAQAWPDVNYADSSKFLLADTDARSFLLSMMNTVVVKGMGEYASNPYAPYSMLSFLALADVATDLEIKNKARITYETTLIQAIAASVQGVYMGATGRSYPDVYPANATGSELMAYLWPYTGLGGLPSAPHQAGGSNLFSYLYLMPCMADYRMPSNLYHLALNRTTGTIAKANFQGKYQYAYFNNNYGIFSQREFNTPFSQSMHSGVNWMNTDTSWTKNTILWFTHPYADSSLANKIHTHGVTGYEKIAQYLGTTVHTYNIPNVDSVSSVYIQKFALGYFSGSYSAIIDNSSNGKVFLHYGKVLIAISSTNTFKCDSLTPPSSALTGLNKSKDFMIRIYGLKFGLAIETANPDDFSGTPMQQLQAFRNQVNQHSIIYNPIDSSTTYTDRFGNIIRSSSSNNPKIADSINHNLIDYSQWPTLSCPGIQETKTGNLVVTYNHLRTFYDYNNWTVTISNDTIVPKLLDTLSVQPKAAYSTRLLRTAYNGAAIKVRRNSDNAQVDVYFDSTGVISLFSKISSVNGVISDTTFGQWAGNASVYVNVWYDQTTNGLNTTQSTVSFQPRIFNQGVLESLDNGTPALRMLNGGNGGTGFSLPFTMQGINQFNLFILSQLDTSAHLAAYHLFGSLGPSVNTPGLLQVNYGTAALVSMSSSTSVSNNKYKLYLTTADFNSVRFRCTPDSNGTFQMFTINKSDSALTKCLTTPFSAAPLTLFRIGGASTNRNFQGLSNEVIYFDTTIIESSATSILQNQQTAYGINPVLNNTNNNYVIPTPVLSSPSYLTDSSFIVNWQQPQGTIPLGSTFTLQYSTTSDFSSGSTTITGIPITSLSQSISHLTASKQYWYRLLINANGGGYNQNEGLWSSVQTINTYPLPVNLLSFTVSKFSKGNHLEWNTTKEINNSYFDIERSLNGTDFSTIGKVEGKGNSSVNQSYQFIDPNPINGINYYRLKQVDKDGSFKYSNVLSINNSSNNQSVLIYPNPITSNLTIEVKGNSTDSYNLNIINSRGEVVKTYCLNSLKESYYVGDLSAGAYLIEIRKANDNELVNTSKLIKKD